MITIYYPIRIILIDFSFPLIIIRLFISLYLYSMIQTINYKRKFICRCTVKSMIPAAFSITRSFMKSTSFSFTCDRYMF